MSANGATKADLFRVIARKDAEIVTLREELATERAGVPSPGGVPTCWRCKKVPGVVFDGTSHECVACAGEAKRKTREMLDQIDAALREGLQAWPKIADRVEFVRWCVAEHRRAALSGGAPAGEARRVVAEVRAEYGRRSGTYAQEFGQQACDEIARRLRAGAGAAPPEGEPGRETRVSSEEMSRLLKGYIRDGGTQAFLNTVIRNAIDEREEALRASPPGVGETPQ